MKMPKRIIVAFGADSDSIIIDQRILHALEMWDEAQSDHFSERGPAPDVDTAHLAADSRPNEAGIGQWEMSRVGSSAEPSTRRLHKDKGLRGMPLSP